MWPDENMNIKRTEIFWVSTEDRQNSKVQLLLTQARRHGTIHKGSAGIPVNARIASVKRNQQELNVSNLEVPMNYLIENISPFGAPGLSEMNSMRRPEGCKKGKIYCREFRMQPSYLIAGGGKGRSRRNCFCPRCQRGSEELMSDW